MKIAILGTRGIPNNYGGFEQFAEHISIGLTKRGHEVTVYNPHYHKHQGDEYKGVKIIYKYSPEKTLRTGAVFLYDFLCLRDALSRDFDIIYEAGYGTCSPSYFLKQGSIKNRPILITNMDGLEWKRDKWNRVIKLMTRYFEKICVAKTDFMVSDNRAIQDYFEIVYNHKSFFIPYGAVIPASIDDSKINEYNLMPQQYFMVIARLEKENNIELTLDSYLKSGTQFPILIIGNYRRKYGKFLTKKYTDPRIKFLGGIYDSKVLDALRKNCLAYIHGHSVGGTNPSLLEAMATQAYIFAHNNVFNKSVLGSNAHYFYNVQELAELFIDSVARKMTDGIKSIEGCQNLIRTEYDWELVYDQYEALFSKLVMKKQELKH